MVLLELSAFLDLFLWRGVLNHCMFHKIDQTGLNDAEDCTLAQILSIREKYLTHFKGKGNIFAYEKKQNRLIDEKKYY